MEMHSLALPVLSKREIMALMILKFYFRDGDLNSSTIVRWKNEDQEFNVQSKHQLSSKFKAGWAV